MSANNINSSVQSPFLNNIRKKKIQVTISLMNGITLQGKITSFDTYTILLENNQQEILVYKQAIAAIIPETKIELKENKIKFKQPKENKPETKKVIKIVTKKES